MTNWYWNISMNKEKSKWNWWQNYKKIHNEEKEADWPDAKDEPKAWIKVIVKHCLNSVKRYKIEIIKN